MVLNFLSSIFGFFDVPKMGMPQVQNFELPDLMPFGVMVLAAVIAILVLRQCKRTRRVEQFQQMPEPQPLRRSQRLINRRASRN